MKKLFLFSLLAASYLSLWGQHLPPVYVALETQYDQNAFEACLAMEKEVESFTRNRLDTLAANSYFMLGDAYHQLGEIDKALGYFERQKDMLTALHLTETSDYSHALNNLTWLYLQRGSYEQAGHMADQLIVNDRKLYQATDADFVASVLYVADTYIQVDRLRDAENLLLNTLRAQDAGSHPRGLLLNKLGDLYSYTGEYSRAMRSLSEALDIHMDHGGEETAEYISAAINLGVLYMNQGKYPEAQEIFEVALTKLDPSEPAYASVLNNQALVLQSLGQLEQAGRALADLKQMDSLTVGTSHPDFAITLSNLGLVYADLGRFAAAEAALTRALSIQKASGEAKTLSFARKLNNLAKVYQLNGSPHKALGPLEEALSIFRKNIGKQSPEYATAAYNLGVALWRAGKGETGFRYLKSSAAIRAKVLGKQHPKYAESILKIAEYQWHRKSMKEARQSFGAVFENYYFQIDQTFPVLTEEEKSKFYYTNIREAFDKFNSFAASQLNADPALAADVYNYLINTKAVIMFATEKVKNAIMESRDTHLIARFELWQSKKEQIARLYSLNQAPAKLDSLLQEASTLEKELARESAAFAANVLQRKYSWTEVRENLKSGEAAVEVLRFRNYNPDTGGFSGDIRYAFLVITPDTHDHPVFIPVPESNDLETKFLRFYRNNIRFQLADTRSYDNYFAPLSKWLSDKNIKQVYFSPDGVYNQININGLSNPASGKFVIDEYLIRLVTNTRELTEKRRPHDDQPSSILIGYPKYNLGDQELRSRDSKSTRRGPALSRTWRGGLLRYMRGDEGISVLPGTQAEIEKIATLFGGSSAAYMEEQASERIARTVVSPTVLHIATHGYFLEDAAIVGNTTSYISNPLLNAGLILAGAENFLKTGEPINDTGDDGILTAFEAMNLRLDETHLVVLSACETGLGEVKNGEGVYGLQRAFKLAGARSIVMSLWNVDDDATQLLMTTFYEEMLRTADQHEAFRTAQQEVRKKYPSPFYWAAFVMVGI